MSIHDDMKSIPIYPHTGAYAHANGEIAQFRESNLANIACKAAIEASIAKHFDGMHLNPKAVSEVMDVFGPERTQYVLANTVQMLRWDGRFSRDNKAWAVKVDVVEDITAGHDRRLGFIVNSHPAVLDGFITQTRQMILQQEHKPSVRAQLHAVPALQKKTPSQIGKRKEAVR